MTRITSINDLQRNRYYSETCVSPLATPSNVRSVFLVVKTEKRKGQVTIVNTANQKLLLTDSDVARKDLVFELSEKNEFVVRLKKYAGEKKSASRKLTREAENIYEYIKRLP